MSEERKPTTRGRSDPELDAMSQIIRSFEPLETDARKRILDWADKRYVNPPTNFDPESFQNFTTAITEASRKIGDMSPIDILRAGLEIKRIRDEQSGAQSETEEQVA